MTALRILLTNISLDTRTGTELYIRDLAIELLRRGHSPVVYTSRSGVVAEDIRAAAVPVVNDLAKLSFVPHIIHGHHRYETMTALIRFPDVPAIFVCHDSIAWHDKPPIHPRIRRYLAVDNTCRDRLLAEGIPEDRIELLFNFVDFKRFHQRPSLPVRPEKALLFSNYARRDTYLPVVEDACARAGMKLDMIGSGVNRSVGRPEEILGQYDLVIAKAKAAMEAMAVGTAVILCDFPGLGPMVTPANFDRLRPLNFGLGALREAITTEGLLREIARYNAQDAARVSQRIRAEAGLESAVDTLVSIYRRVVEGEKNVPQIENEGRANTAFVYELLYFCSKLENVQADNQNVINKLAAAENVIGMQQQEITSLEERIGRLQSLEHILTFRIRKRLRKVPGLVALAVWWEKIFKNRRRDR